MIGKEGSKHELTCCIFLYYSKKNCSRAFLSYMVWQEHLAEITTDISIFPRSRQQLFQNCICHRQTHLQKLLQLGKCFFACFFYEQFHPNSLFFIQQVFVQNSGIHFDSAILYAYAQFIFQPSAHNAQKTDAENKQNKTDTVSLNSLDSMWP